MIRAKRNMHEIRIVQADNGGIIVYAGCKTFVFSNTSDGRKELVTELAIYLKDPTEYEKSLINQCNENKALAAAEPVDPLPRY